MAELLRVPSARNVFNWGKDDRSSNMLVGSRTDHRWARTPLEIVPMSIAKSEPVYFDLMIVAASPSTDIWLGDHNGHFVQKETGTLETSLLPGDYTVEFGLGTTTYPIHLTKSSRCTQQELAAGPTCFRPIPKMSPE